MGRFLDLLKAERDRCIKGDWDSWIMTTGIPGMGKSWAVLKAAEDANPDFCLDDVVFNTEDMAARARAAPRGSIIILDEGIRGAMSRESMTGRNRGLKTFSATGRFYNHVYFILNPEKTDFDKTIIDRVRYWLVMVSRGKALLHRGQDKIYKKPGKARGFSKMYGFTVDADPPKCWDEYLVKKDRQALAAQTEAQGGFVPEEAKVIADAAKVRRILGLA